MRRNFIQTTLMTLALTSLTVEAGATAYWSTDFRNGRFPEGMFSADIMGPEPKSSAYKNISTGQAWTIGPSGADYAVFSPSFNGDEKTPMENYLFLPFVKIEQKGALMRWRARNMIPEIPENYRIGYRMTEDDDFTFISDFEETSGDWETRLLDLSEFEGKEVQFTICCVSNDRFLLGIKNIFIGIPEETEVECRMDYKAFVANGPAEATAYLRNTGTHLTDATFRLETSNGEDIVRTIEGEWKTGETRELTFGYTPREDGETSLTLKLDGTSAALWKGKVYSSIFERRHVVDEGTGTWCVKCPSGILELRKLSQTFGSQMITLATHTLSGTEINDPMYNPTYWSNLKFYAVPYFMLDRGRNTIGSNTKNFESHYNRPTTAKIDIKGWSIEGNSLKVNTSSMFAYDTENSEDEYGICYVLTKDLHSEESSRLWFQSNSLSSPTGDQYYYLASRIPSQLAYFRHVTLTDENAFEPVAGSLPANIQAMTGMDSEITIPLPTRTDPSATDKDTPLVSDFQGMDLVVFILNSKNGTILNADSRHIEGESWKDESGISAPIAENSPAMTVSGDTAFYRTSGSVGRYVVEIYGYTGMMLSRTEGIENGGSLDIPLLHGEGVIVRVTSEAGTATVRTIR